MVQWVGLQCVIVVFPDHTHLLFDPDQARLNVNLIWENIRLDRVEYCTLFGFSNKQGILKCVFLHRCLFV